jgi:hypothetical protein
MQQAEAPYAVERTRPFILTPGRQAVLDRVESAEKKRLLCEPLEEAIVALKMATGREHGDPGTEVAPDPETVETLADFAIAAISRGDGVSQTRGARSRSGAGLQSVSPG